ncbi:hypothetical protein ACVINI_006539 [Rhizobium beringeri]
MLPQILVEQGNNNYKRNKLRPELNSFLNEIIRSPASTVFDVLDGYSIEKHRKRWASPTLTLPGLDGPLYSALKGKLSGPPIG